MTDRLLVLVRHGESEWNLTNLFTGWKDVDLTENGVKEARNAGRKLKAQGINILEQTVVSGGRRVCFFEGPDGVQLEFIEMKA